MPKLHVLVDKQGMVVATGPAPEIPVAGKAEAGPVYAGFSVGDGGEGFKTYEVDVDDRTNLSRRDPDVDRFHSRLGELIRTKKDLKQIEFRR